MKRKEKKDSKTYTTNDGRKVVRVGNDKYTCYVGENPVRSCVFRDIDLCCAGTRYGLPTCSLDFRGKRNSIYLLKEKK